jgi:hypothetical protein
MTALASKVCAQETQFASDPNGNLLAQGPSRFAPPQIVAQPQMQVVVEGELASFFVVAADTSGLSYQWLFNGANLPGQTSDALLISNVSSNNQGYYSVVLANSSGSVTSSPAPLWIDSRGCGMPDWWQLYYFGNLTQNATGDSDGDGVSNLQEFLDGTNPTNSASARYRLTLFTDGGDMQLTPNQSSYSNGTVVTLTATTGSFHAWLGDVVSQSNPVNLTMSTNKTVFARFTPVDFVWTNSAGGDWSVATNWNPNLVPLPNDNASITMNLTVTVTNPTECANLILGNAVSAPSLSVTRTLTIHGAAFYAGGQISGGGRLVVGLGATFVMTNGTGYSLNNLTWENDGTTFWSGTGNIGLNNSTVDNVGTFFWTGAGDINLNGAIITNRPGAVFEAQNAATLIPFAIPHRFDNAGTFRKTSNSNACSVPLFNNYGTVDLQAGTLLATSTFTNTGTVRLAAGACLVFQLDGFSSGPFNAAATALVEWADGGYTFTFAPGAQLNGIGIYRINSGTLLANTDLSVANFDFVGGALNGPGALMVNNAMNWTLGTMSGSGRTLIGPGADLNLVGASGVTLSRTLENAGTILWTGAGNLTLNGGIITNRAGAVFEAQNAATLASFNSPHEFDNAGIFRKAINAGTLMVNVPLNNFGTVDIRAGVLVANNGYASTPNALLNCALGGTTPGTSYGQLQCFGTLTLNGALSVDLANGFVPATNNSFTVLTAGTRAGAFANFYYPSNEVTMQLSNTTTSVVVLVTGVAVPPPAPLLQSPLLSGSNVLLTWTAVSNVAYRVEFNPNLGPSNWTALAGDVTSLSNFASKLDPLTSSNRFYRVHVLP